MATKRNGKIRASSEPAPKGRKTKTPRASAVPASAPTPAEPVPAQLAGSDDSSAREIVEPPPALLPVPAGADTPAQLEALPDQATRTKKLSALDAAVRVLVECGQAMSCPELIAAMAAKGYWKSPNGKTPSGTLYSALLRELQSKGDQARFCKTGRGKFALRPTV
jgi:hypothetical protein